MRQRKVKNLDEKLKKVSDYRIEEPKLQKGKWAEIFQNDNPIYLELGCGKGQFVLSYAKKYQDRNYIAIEGQESVCLRAMEKAAGTAKKSIDSPKGEPPLKNIVFVSEFIEDIEEYFKEEELSGIYLNFSDPWPKARHKKRRLTYGGKLLAYSRILKIGSAIEIKTDNDSLFQFTIEEMEEIEAGNYQDSSNSQSQGQSQVSKNTDTLVPGLKRTEVSFDLHNTELLAKEMTTEYEDKFDKAGKNINYMKIVKLDTKESLC